MTTPAKFYPGGGKLYARIAKDGKIVCIFKAPPTNTQGHAMAKALDSSRLDEAERLLRISLNEPFSLAHQRHIQEFLEAGQ